MKKHDARVFLDKLKQAIDRLEVEEVQDTIENNSGLECIIRTETVGTLIIELGYTSVEEEKRLRDGKFES